MSTPTSKSRTGGGKENRVGNYIILRKIGSGSFANVFLGKHSETHQKVAVKSISKLRLSKNSKHSSNLESEISIMKSLSHPNVISLIDILYTTNHIYLILEYANCGDLHDYIRQKGKLTETQVKKLMKQLVDGLNFIHSKNLAHRDLKPQNLLLHQSSENDTTSEIQLRIGDFGFARVMEEMEGAMAATLCGSPLYMVRRLFLALLIIEHRPSLSITLM